ncbi:MAG: AAA family ATPase [Deltaproteobacteria bacterium]|nr:AAA family ATPase [Deltaproteobacteria bacterium]
MIRQVTIKNFNSLKHVTTELKPLTIIIGPNASGKSNFLDGLEAVKHLVQFKGTTRPGREGDQPTIPVEEVLWRKSKSTEEVSWELDYELRPNELPARQLSLFEDESNYENFTYSLAIKNAVVDEEELPIIVQEKLTASPGQYEFFFRSEDNIKVQSSTIPVDTDISLTDLALHFYARKSLPVARDLRYYIREWQFYKIIPHLIRQSLFSRPGKHSRLAKDGSNLANVLHLLRKHQPGDFEYIQNEMLASLGFSRLYTKEEDEGIRALQGRGRVYLEAEEEVFANSKPFGPDNLSDGTLGLLALLTVLSISKPAPFICLEEPERSIHLQLIPRLAHYLHEAAQGTQLIVTTHSPEFLDHFDPYEQDYVQVLIAHRDNEGATQFVPIRKVQNIQKWLDEYMLGQIWTMGQIEEILETA